jgi:hypothetical protein
MRNVTALFRAQIAGYLFVRPVAHEERVTVTIPAVTSLIDLACLCRKGMNSNDCPTSRGAVLLLGRKNITGDSGWAFFGMVTIEEIYL